jgi:type IV secretion system protein VirD4
MAFAPTRSGKGVGLVVPTLLAGPGSAVVHDIKGENWTADRRLARALLALPAVQPDRRALGALQSAARSPPRRRRGPRRPEHRRHPGRSGRRARARNHWEKTSHSLLVGAILHVLYAEEEKTLARRRDLPVRSAALHSSRHAAADDDHQSSRHAEARVHPVVASAAREVLNKSENERSGVLSTAMSFLGLYRDPTVAEVTSRCDWRIADLVEGKSPVTLYLVVPPSDISRTKPLVRLVLNQIGRRLTEPARRERRRPQAPLLMMLDEFPALGRLDFFETASPSWPATASAPS